jgi:hypothetical protein
MKKIFLIGLLISYCTVTAQENKITYNEVVEKLIDLKTLATIPEPGEKSAMWSSYDRESKIDPETGEFINWAANDDGLNPQFIRKEGEMEVLAEMEGPGAIVRIWSASPGQGNVKIYIDGNEEPLVDLPFIDYFKGGIPAFDFPELVYETNARGFNNYVPITYQKSCKIVASPGWGQYYHFNYISFPGDTQVETFDPEPKDEARKALEKVNDFFAEEMGNSPHRFTSKPQNFSEKIPAGEKKQLLKLENSGAISSLKVRLKNANEEDLEEILRKVTFQIHWDGEEQPAVWSPLGDFFGTSPGWNEYRTLPMGMADGWMYSYWYMPFENGAEIILKNEFSEEIAVEMEVQIEDLDDEVENYTRFHAKWHRDLEPLEEERWPDWTLLETKGKGRFVGTHLLVWNPKGGSCSAAGPGHHWWGEGDEKFFVDGETFPSTFGTGTEDYFGYAWCDPSHFEHAFHSQTQNNDNMGYQPMNRWHIIDNIPFQKSFDGYMEKYFPNHWPTQYNTVVYWYLAPGGEDPLWIVPVEERYGFEIPFNVFREEGVVEGEALHIKENTGGWASPDVWAHESLYEEVSGHKVLIWHAEPDRSNVLKLNFDWPKAGTYKVEVNKVHSRDGGKFELLLNGESRGVLDFHSELENGDTEKVKLGTIKIEPGPQNIELRFAGDLEDGNAMRLDYLRLEKVD